MARQSEQPAESNSLPKPEVNPLLNPLLAQNMGRWAEIYYTNPPEKREAAVLELLRELEAQNPAGEAPAPRAPEPDQAEGEHAPLSELQPGLQPELFSSCIATPQPQPTALVCPRCGHQNPPDHFFCGECGRRLGTSSTPQRREFEFPSAEETQQRQDFIHSESTGEEPSAVLKRAAEPDTGGASLNAGVWPGSEVIASNRNAADVSPDWNAGAAQTTAVRSYRIYIAVVLAVVILVLLYMAWRGTKASRQSHRLPAPPAMSQQTAPSAGPAPGAVEASKPASSTPLEAPKNNPAPQAPSTSSSGAKSELPGPEPLQKASSMSPAASNSQVAPLPGPGGEELAVAQRYLNGASGQPPDPAEAAEWLWKAVAKKNAEATLLLADLYLKGNGVPKNCDQARVLLDAAASKGVPGALEKLRNLQAFGCQ